MRFTGTCYRAHDPRWSFRPLSGDGAALRGGRFNRRGVPALYLACSLVTAVKEITQGFARKIEPCVLCAYEVDCEDVADLTTQAGLESEGVAAADMACAWFGDVAAGRDPPSWLIADRLMARGRAGALVPSFAPGAGSEDVNLVLWTWGRDLPHRVHVHDPSGRLARDQLSWREEP